MDEDKYGRIIKLLRETVIMLCKSGVQFDHQLRVQGLIGVTVDDGTVFLVHMNDCVSEDGCSSADTSKPVQSSVKAEAGSHQSDVDVVNEQDEAEACQWSKSPEASASQYSRVKQESETGSTDRHGECQNAAESPSLTTSLSFVQQNDFWDVKDDDVICVDAVEPTSHQTSVGNTCAESAIWNPHQYSVLSAAGQSEYDVSDSTTRKIFETDKTLVSYAPIHNETSQFGETPDIKTAYGETGVTHYLSTPKSQSSGIGSTQRRHMVPHTIPQQSWRVPYSSEPQPQFVASHQPTAFQRMSANMPPRPKRGRPRRIDMPVSAEFGSTMDDDANRWDMVKVTKFACKLCGQAFNHQPNLFRHQITAHGRQKKTRRGRPVAKPS